MSGIAVLTNTFLYAIFEEENHLGGKMAIIEINSLSAPELDAYLRLSENQLRNRLNPEDALFIAESPNVIRSALDAGLLPVSAFCEKNYLSDDLMEKLGDIPVYVAPRELLSSIKGYALTRGMHSAMRRPKPLGLDDVLSGARRVAVLENIVDATNIGALFRSAAALNIDAVLRVDGDLKMIVRTNLLISHIPNLIPKLGNGGFDSFSDRFLNTLFHNRTFPPSHFLGVIKIRFVL